LKSHVGFSKVLQNLDILIIFYTVPQPLQPHRRDYALNADWLPWID
jgi:hypothetical protein